MPKNVEWLWNWGMSFEEHERESLDCLHLLLVEKEMLKVSLVSPQKREGHSREKPYHSRGCWNHEKTLLEETWMLKTLMMRTQKKVRSMVKKFHIFLENINPHKQNVCGSVNVKGAATVEDSQGNEKYVTGVQEIFVRYLTSVL